MCTGQLEWCLHCIVTPVCTADFFLSLDCLFSASHMYKLKVVMPEINKRVYMYTVKSLIA